MKIKATKTEPTSGSYMAVWSYKGGTFATSIRIDENEDKWEITSENRNWQRQKVPINEKFTAHPEIRDTLIYMRLE